MDIRLKQDLLQKEIRLGNYMKAEEICNKMQGKKARDVLFCIAYDKEDISVYSFIQYMIKKTGKAEWTDYAVFVMINAFWHLEGGYSAALSHSREVVKLERSAENLLMILSYYEIPEKLVLEDEALSLVEEILAMEPENEMVLGIKQRIAESQAKLEERKAAIARQSKKDLLREKLWRGNYTEAEEICGTMQEQEINEALFYIAHDMEEISAYSFIQYMMRRTDDIEWEKRAAYVMAQAFGHLEGGYSAALYHAREVVKRQRNVENLQRLLLFYEIPEKLINEDEALSIAEEILGLEPDNETALGVKRKIVKCT